ncbi:MAG: tetratricopeptide repeat protein [Promethearchaeota archaeon]
MATEKCPKCGANVPIIIWKNFGDILVEFCKYEEAIEKYQKALEIIHNDDILWNNFGYFIDSSIRFSLSIYSKSLL